MKKLSILFIMLFCATVMLAQNVTKHPKNGKAIIIYDNGTWAYKPETGSFKDSRDGKTYKTVSIGTQVWMAENLAYKASNGCWAYNNSSSNVTKYGYLYNWETAKNVCPAGWHLPSDEEWKTLERNLGMTATEANESGYRGEGIGKKMKSATGWELHEGKNYGNNESGFNALPGGYRYAYDGSFRNAGEGGYWWSSTPDGSEDAWRRDLLYDGGGVGRDAGGRTGGYSVRCLKDN